MAIINIKEDTASLWLIALPSLLVLLLFLPALGNGFVWDDNITFFQAPHYRDPNLLSLGDAFTTPFIYSTNYYRPLVVISFMLQLRTLGVDAFGLHLSSILLHCINTLLLILVARALLSTLYKEKKDAVPVNIPAILVGLIYGLHPALIEPVIYISSRFDLMATSFLLLALLADRRILHPALRAVTVGLVFFMAALCKEIAIAFPLMLPFLHLASLPDRTMSLYGRIRLLAQRGDLYVYIAVTIAGIIYLVMRNQVVPGLLDMSALPVDNTGSPWQHLLLIGRSFSEYFLLTFNPFFRLSPVHPVTLPVSMTDTAAWSGLVLLIGFISFSIWAGFRRNARWWLLSAAIAAYLPILSLLPAARPTDAFFAESFLVFPLSITLLALLPIITAWLNEIQIGGKKYLIQTGYFIATLWTVLCIFILVTTTPLWRDDVSLWLWAESNQKDNYLVQSNLSNGYFKKRDHAHTLIHARLARDLKPDLASPWNNIGLALTNLGELHKGEAAHRKAVSLEPEHPVFLTSLGDNLQAQHRYREAEGVFRKALKIDTTHTYTRVKLAALLAKLHRKEDARKEMSRAISELPAGEERNNLEKWLNQLSVGPSKDKKISD